MRRIAGEPGRCSSGRYCSGALPGRPAIELRNLEYRHRDSSSDVLHRIDLRVEAGEKILITGPSGSGKSTLLRVLAGLEEDATWSGTRTVEAPVGLVLQDPDSQVIASRVGDDVAFGCENLRIPRQDIWARVEGALARVGLEVPLDYPTSLLSGGQKQRLALAGVLAMGARVILLDEPTANLDPAGRREVMEAVSSLDSTVVIVDHKPWPVDRVLLLDHGQLQEGEFPQRPALPPARSCQAVPSLVTAQDLLTGWGHLEQIRRSGSHHLGESVHQGGSQPAAYGKRHSFRIPQGRSTVIVGPNGAGKTTLALTIAGLLDYQGGELLMAPSLFPDTQHPPHQSARRLLQARPAHWSSRDLASRIGFVFQNPEHQFVARTVRAELETGFRAALTRTSRGGRRGGVCGRRPPRGAEAAIQLRVDELLDRLRLRHCEYANPFTLSGGEKRRLSVATSLVSAPTLLLLDEPTFGQDPDTFAELVSLLRDLSDDGVTVVSVTHDEDFIATLGDHRIEVTAS